jgi:RNA polymerase sigma-70 factor, ECF subfamily
MARRAAMVPPTGRIPVARVNRLGRSTPWEGEMTVNPDFEAFFAANHEEVVRALTLALADRARAEDAAQEAFAKAYRRWKRVAMMDRPVAWVYVVALNGARKELRRDNAAPVPELAGPTADHAAAAAAKVSVRDALAVLAPRQRVAVVLRYLGDLRVSEVAEAMGCSEGTAKATLHTALAKLRNHLGPLDAPTDPTPPSAPASSPWLRHQAGTGPATRPEVATR